MLAVLVAAVALAGGVDGPPDTRETDAIVSAVVQRGQRRAPDEATTPFTKTAAEAHVLRVVGGRSWGATLQVAQGGAWFESGTSFLVGPTVGLRSPGPLRVAADLGPLVGAEVVRLNPTSGDDPVWRTAGGGRAALGVEHAAGRRVLRAAATGEVRAPLAWSVGFSVGAGVRIPRNDAMEAP